jgi:hypothetical protein
MTVLANPEIDGFEAAFQAYLDGVRKLYQTWARPTYPSADVRYEVGPRYIRVITENGHDRNVHTFVDRTNGDILKAAGWKAPAKNGVRGSILSEDHGLSKVNWHGAIYLR